MSLKEKDHDLKLNTDVKQLSPRILPPTSKENRPQSPRTPQPQKVPSQISLANKAVSVGNLKSFDEKNLEVKLAVFQKASDYKSLLLNNEEIHEKDSSASVLFGKSYIPGVLLITNFRVVFIVGGSLSTYVDVSNDLDIISIPLCSLHKVEKIGGKTSSKENYCIEMNSKDGRIIKLLFQRKENTRGKIFNAISEELNTSQFFAFKFRLPSTSKSTMINGWEIYSEESEFKRQGAFLQNQWRISKINENFEFCDTYPRYICVPKDFDDDNLKQVSFFRSRGRLPCLTWINKNTGASITRSSQPLIGINLMNKKKKEDHDLIQAILKANPSGNLIHNKLMIVDLRPKLNADANLAFKGAGYERNYDDCDLKFMNIPNIHTMRSSFLKVIELVQSGGYDVQWFTKLEATGWLEHVRNILVASAFFVDELIGGVSILTHCRYAMLCYYLN